MAFPKTGHSSIWLEVISRAHFFRQLRCPLYFSSASQRCQIARQENFNGLSIDKQTHTDKYQPAPEQTRSHTQLNRRASGQPIRPATHKSIQTGNQASKEAGKQASKQANNQTSKQTIRQVSKQASKQSDK